MEVRVKNSILRSKEEQFEIEVNGKIWKSHPNYKNTIVLNNGRSILFESAKQIEKSVFETSYGKGILTRYRDIKGVNFAFDTRIWIETSTQEIFFEWIPVNDNGFDIKEILWPSPMCCEGVSYLPFKEHTFPWIAQIKENKEAYMMVSETPWDMGCAILDSSYIQFKLYPSLGKMQYRRILRCVFMEEANIDQICTYYKKCLKEKGVTTLSLTKEIPSCLTLDFTQRKVSKFECIQNAEGSFKENQLCDTLMLAYIKQIISTEKQKAILFKNFNRLEECNNPSHRMSKKQCMEERIKVIQYVKAKDIAVYVEEMSEWILPYATLYSKEEDLGLLYKMYEI